MMGSESLSNVVAFIIIFILCNHLVGLVFWFLAKTFQFIKLVPFFGIINRLGGAVLGFIEGLFVLGIILSVIDLFLRNPNLAEQISRSQLAQLMLGAARILNFILPSAFNGLENLI